MGQRRYYPAPTPSPSSNACSGRPGGSRHPGFVVDRDGSVIDEVLAVPMLSTRSYTREDVVELQCRATHLIHLKR
uniref:GTP-binding protein TrmE N-terminal domain-containing protein n=1 Tax=Aegilops tauschii subsp. strangulata TaxID=200361 RepID=A0A453K609_AEGTS